MSQDPNSLCLWYPIVEKLVPTPRTVIIPFKREWGLLLLDGDVRKDALNAIDEASEAARTIGFPCFMRTDQCSGKHDWENTCYIKEDGYVTRNIGSLIDYNEAVDLMGLNYSAIVIREFLHSPHTFTAYRGMPVTLERRIFIKDGTVQCDHPYWREDSVGAGRPSSDGWTDDFRRLYGEYEINQDMRGEVRRLAATVADAMPGYWSVDFLWAERENRMQWYLIDMATGEQSYHIPDCEYAQEDRP